MSTSIFKVPYKCDCGIDYGNCGADCAIILVSNNTSDTYNLMHTDGHGGTFTTDESPSCFGDNYLSALRSAIAMKDHNGDLLTESEREAVSNRFLK